ncbi:MAG: hypothetical protein JW969_14690 [Spirochaetales bacterium]|nr:hypothetical protein [Spirochaetales bacterium]
MKKKIISITLLFILGSIAFGDDSDIFLRYITEDTLRQLQAKEELNRTAINDSSLTLIPDIDEKKEIIKDVAELNPVIISEVLLLHHHPVLRVGAMPPVTKIYRTLLEISTLKGIEYYSASREQMRTFFYDAYVVDSPDSRERLPDPVFTSNRTNKEVYAFVKDSSFGDYVCSIRYRFTAEIVNMKITNATTVWVFFIPVVEPDYLRSYLYIIPGNKSILFYGFSCVKIKDLFGLVQSKQASIYNRVKALYNWFISRYDP